MRIWAKTIQNHKIQSEVVREFALARPSDLKGWMPLLHELCQVLDLSRPVVLEKHIRELERFSHTAFRPSDFIGEIHRPYNTLEGIAEVFHKFSSDVIIDKVNADEWAFSFADEGIDPYVYHVEQNVFGLEYHRFTRGAYAKMMAL